MSLSEERLQKAYNYLKYIGLVKTQKDFAEKIGTKNVSMSHAMHGNPRYLTKSLFSKVYKTYKDIFSEKWLLTGEGEMLANTSTYVNANGTDATAINGNNNNINNATTEKYHEIHDAKPIIPKYLASKPNTDVYEFVSMNKNINLDTLVAIPPYKDFDFYYQVRQDAMQPLYMIGDMIALVHMDGTNIIQGSTMVIDTRDFGFLLRRIYDRGDYYECKVINDNSAYESQNINKDNVIRLYRVMYSIRLGD